MAGFMNDELKALKENLFCEWCSKRFTGSDSQARKVKYENQKVYCTKECRLAAASKRLKKPIPENGPCPTCGQMFRSKTAKTFCSLECYNKSPQFRDMLKKAGEKGNAKTQEIWAEKMKQTCPVCGEVFRAKVSKRKYCSHLCYRKFKASLFDAWVANPQNIELPQGYDEFLLNDELHCLVDGCEWKGKHLSVHLNVAHGIYSDDFKKEVGFNLKTGLVVPELHEKMVSRDKVGVAASEELRGKGQETIVKKGIKRNPYKSTEGRLNAKKSRMLDFRKGPIRVCSGCGCEFEQTTVYGKSKYCTKECRSEHYAKTNKAKAKTRVRQKDGTFNWI